MAPQTLCKLSISKVNISILGTTTLTALAHLLFKLEAYDPADNHQWHFASNMKSNSATPSTSRFLRPNIPTRAKVLSKCIKYYTTGERDSDVPIESVGWEVGSERWFVYDINNFWAAGLKVVEICELDGDADVSNYPMVNGQPVFFGEDDEDNEDDGPFDDVFPNVSRRLIRGALLNLGKGGDPWNWLALWTSGRLAVARNKFNNLTELFWALDTAVKDPRATREHRCAILVAANAEPTEKDVTDSTKIPSFMVFESGTGFRQAHLPEPDFFLFHHREWPGEEGVGFDFKARFPNLHAFLDRKNRIHWISLEQGRIQVNWGQMKPGAQKKRYKGLFKPN
ncbi:hypothetical protein HK102_000503 [Quaeritorhiza haematococci]|nr:hypothetical protein HK102_000503 [Quaeritorhiza haematococci]